MSRGRHDIEFAHRRKRCAPERAYSAHQRLPRPSTRPPDIAERSGEGSPPPNPRRAGGHRLQSARSRPRCKTDKITEQLPLYLRQLDPRLLLASLRLTDFAAAYSPVENRQCEVSYDVISEV